MKTLPYTVKATYPDAASDAPKSVVTVKMDNIRSGWEQWFLLASDRHWDNPMSDRHMQRRHLEEAENRNAGILDAGDLLCVMQGRDDKRGGKSSLRPEDNTNAYYDAVVKNAAAWFAPWAHRFVTMSPGNHESAVLKRHETDLTSRLVDSLNTKTGSNIQRMTYAGFVRFHFVINKTKSCAVQLFYHHGWGGGGPVTRGVIDTNRMAVYVTDAQLVWTGHTHDNWNVPIMRSRLSKEGVPFLDEQIHFRTPGYKDEFSPLEGFHIEKGRAPKPIGAAWLRFWMNPGDSESGRVSYEVLRAK